LSTESNPVFETRTRHRLTQQALAERLGVAKNYIYLIESGRKPLTKAISQKLSELDTHAPVHLTPVPTPSTPCRYPEACDIQAEFGQLREELASMTAQLDTVTRLLGAALGSALPAQREHNPPHKAHPHRAAG
jgi:transcriptional regulator with XRE-family HTH domain